MKPETVTQLRELPNETDQATHPPACPRCGSPLFELRGFQRCSRCYAVVCEGCEGSEAES